MCQSKPSGLRSTRPEMEDIFKVDSDVLSGKPCQSPPVRGAFGEATIPLKQGYRSRRHRIIQMKGERDRQ